METNKELESIVQPLLAWFDANARVLPWRDSPTPYRVWVSEIMLQQTRVEAVKPFFQRFTEALPDVAALAACEEEKLLKLWEGLGYYNRVRNMQKAAQTVMEEYGGELPADYEKLLKLKGIGSYTAGAIASIAFQIPVPAVDGNVLRVISRITASEKDILKASVKKEVEDEIREIIPPERAGAFNQALMELGAVVCVPNGPAKCDACPLYGQCLARERGIVSSLPKKSAAKPRRVQERTVLIIRDGERVAIHKRPPKGLLAGLYELPNVEGHLGQEEVLKLLKKKHFSPIRIQPLEEAKHIFSHVEWHMTGYVITVEEPERETEYLFVEPRETEENYPVPAAFSAYTKYLQIKLGQEKYKEENKEL
ncbi:A/G-specific adenine glycosylase [Marvinbryantia formatexigens DSM 14469]|uniref:Adenine DNA glycosylase n=1 Tax=Marvinbryantia formatexigens DSM 14469 TaxID=478749 RepID=C6LA88_9FIRM|nr:A/G-specific adenine glycosylase [Marvinbryantia formatexigens]EET62495.1 A/G-specific adenine glycosylase [Marvinbryantia formatexigens DSM 14469]UWO24978.1 A/G-specific adenine glycosylase [Marvinbryantia formatexigens DSM 14469]SDG26075.1 A/G-specific DNA-adenine glycosylase [Marvinbryantia formatexigens]